MQNDYCIFSIDYAEKAAYRVNQRRGSAASRGKITMRNKILAALLLASAAPVSAQDINSTSGSNAAANSGSISAAQSSGNEQAQGQGQSQTSNSNSGAVSGSESVSGAISDQAQGQTQGQALDARNTQTQGQTATNSQGVSTTLTFNNSVPKRTYVGTNAAVPLVASSSFSSDYCGGTVSGGASVAPIGVSLGMSAPKYDNSCRYLRMAEKAGMLAANYFNMHQTEMAMRAQSLMVWGVCMAGPQQDKRRDTDQNYTMQACLALGLLGSDISPPTPPPVAPPAPAPASAPNPEVTPPQVQKYTGERGSADTIPSGTTPQKPDAVAFGR